MPLKIRVGLLFLSGAQYLQILKSDSFLRLLTNYTSPRRDGRKHKELV